jgi:hypothetical protein
LLVLAERRREDTVQRKKFTSGWPSMPISSIAGASRCSMNVLKDCSKSHTSVT